MQASAITGRARIVQDRIRPAVCDSRRLGFTTHRDRTGIGEEDALTWDLGLALDLAILPLVDVGLHAAYNGLETEEALQWWSAGVHGAITF